MVEEKKIASPTPAEPEESAAYSDLIDLIYSGGDDGNPSVMEYPSTPLESRPN